jgi:hypothetical protein
LLARKQTGNAFRYYHLRLIPLVAPPPSMLAPALPKNTGRSPFTVSVSAHAPSKNEMTRTRTGLREAVRASVKVNILGCSYSFEICLAIENPQ